MMFYGFYFATKLVFFPLKNDGHRVCFVIVGVLHLMNSCQAVDAIKILL